MGKQFQMLEDLERIIDSGYGESESEPDEIEEAVNPQKIKMLLTSFVSLAKDAIGDLKGKDSSGALQNLAFMVDSIGDTLRDPKVKKYAGELRTAILSLAGEGEPSMGPGAMESEEGDE
jgi:hypothetical protein